MTSPIMTMGGKPLTIAGKIAMLFGTVGMAVALPVPGAPMPTTGMAGWWDAAALAPGQTYNTLPDKSPAGRNANAGGARAVAHMAGLLNGLYVESSPYVYPYGFSELYPLILDYAIGASSVPVGAGGALTVFLVWSRANQRQVSGARVASTVPLVDVGGTTVLSMTGNGDGNDTLLLNGAALGKLELRHTHSMRLVYSGANVDLWFDGAKVGSSTVAQLGATTNLAFLNAAQCIFHEAAVWSKVLGTAEHSDLSGYAQRWPLGPRRAINGVLIGQSNAAYFVSTASHILVARRVAYLTGCLSSNLLFKSGSYGALSSSTVYSGQGLYTFLDSSSGGSPATWAGGKCPWPLAANGVTFMSALDSMTADERDNLRYIAQYWSESDSTTLTPENKSTYLGAVKREIELVRAHLGKTAEQLPYLVIDALPAGGADVGCQIHREVMADLIADSSQNVHRMLALAGDAISLNDGWDSATGIESGNGEGSHRNLDDVPKYARRFSAPIARAALAANAATGTPDVLSTIDASIPQIGGPKVLSATAESGTSVLVTVQHDGGSDLTVPLRAALGVGWTLNGLAIKATACARVNATQMRLTFPSVPAGALLYYSYGSNLDANNYAVIGRGNAVTDNFSSVTLTPGWGIGSDLGDPANEQPNNPLQATPYGVALTGG